MYCILTLTMPCFYTMFNTPTPFHLSLCCIRRLLLKCNFIIIKRNPRVSDCTFANAVFNFSLHLRLMERPAIIFQQEEEVKQQRRRLVLHCSRLAMPLPPPLPCCLPPVLLVYSQQSQPNALNNISHWFPLVFLFLLSSFSLSRCPYISCVLLLA